MLCWSTHASLFGSFLGYMGLKDTQAKHSGFRDLLLSINFCAVRYRLCARG